MSDIPDDVIATASQAAFDYFNSVADVSLFDAIARAIMDERERCYANIADREIGIRIVERSRCVASARVLGYGGCGNDVADRLEAGQ